MCVAKDRTSSTILAPSIARPAANFSWGHQRHIKLSTISPLLIAFLPLSTKALLIPFLRKPIFPARLAFKPRLWRSGRNVMPLVEPAILRPLMALLHRLDAPQLSRAMLPLLKTTTCVILGQRQVPSESFFWRILPSPPTSLMDRKT